MGALDVIEKQVQVVQEEVAVDAYELEAASKALMEHHLALRRFMYEWLENQEQLLPRMTLRMPDCPAVQITSKETVEGEGAAWPSTPAQFMPESAIIVVPVDDMARQPSRKGPERKTHSEPTSKHVHANVCAVPVGAEDLPNDPQQHERAGERRKLKKNLSSLSTLSQATAWPQFTSPDAGPTEPQQDPTENLMQWAHSVNHFVEGVNDGVNKHVACPLINRLEESRFFGCFTGLVIMVNAISMAVAADYEMDNFRQPTNKILVHIELVFIGIYTLELVVRIIARRLAFFLLPWSWFDIAIVGVGWLEVISSSSTSLTQVRLMRVLKMLKVMRVLRVMRSLREVRLLLNSLMGSIKPLLWTVIIITGINFMFGICFVQSIAAFRHDNWTKSAHGESEQDEAFYGPWTSVPQAMYTLFKVSTGGVSWGEVSDPMLILGWQTFGIFLLYIALFMFVMANAVTAIFVSSAEEYASKDAHTMIYDQLKAKNDYMNQVNSLYDEMDVDDSGEVTRHEFVKYMSDPRMTAFASSLNIESVDLDQFFDVLSCRGVKAVDLETFVDGCIRLRGPARSMDVLDLLMRQDTIAEDVGRVHAMLEQLTSRVQA